MNTDIQTPQNEKQTGKKSWLKKLGIFGFLFFLLKGIAWLFVFYFGVKFSGCRQQSSAYIFSGNSIPSIVIA